MKNPALFSLELCAGAGGQALGLHEAGFGHVAVAEIDPVACATLRANQPGWNVLEEDIKNLSGRAYRGIDLLAGGVPCPPFSIAGKQLGEADDRDLFPAALHLVEESRPSAVMLENVSAFASARFAEYRRKLAARLERLGYLTDWQVLNACNYGVPQLRPRFVLVAFRSVQAAHRFGWPPAVGSPPLVGETLVDMMAERGWRGAEGWAQRARGIAPTLVGGSKKHGGPDVGPTRAREAWRALAVNGKTIAEEAPELDFPADGLPRLTVRMGGRIQGFPDSWTFVGKKTAAWRQVGNAFPPPVARAVATAIRAALLGLPLSAGSEQQLAMPFRIA